MSLSRSLSLSLSRNASTRLRFAAALLVMLGILLAPRAVAAHAAPGTKSATPANKPATITVVDDHGTRVVLHGYPRRIISLAPNVTEILYAIGLGNRVVGVSQDSDYPAAVKSKPVVLTTSGANLEKIVALHPDVLIGAGIDASYLLKLHTLHLPTIILDPHSISGVLHDITLAGTATGATARAQSLVASLRTRMLAIAQHLRHAVGRPRVLYELGADKAGVYTYGPDTFGDDLITRAGGTNVGRSGKTAYPELNPEQIIAARPQVIVLGDAAYGTSAASVRARPGYSALPAVRLGHIYPFNDDLVSRPGPRIIDGLEKMARLLHPEAFK